MTRAYRRSVWNVRWFGAYGRPGFTDRRWSLHLWSYPPHPLYRTPRGAFGAPAPTPVSFTLADAANGETLVCPVCLYSRLSPYARMAVS